MEKKSKASFISKINPFPKAFSYIKKAPSEVTTQVKKAFSFINTNISFIDDTEYNKKLGKFTIFFLLLMTWFVFSLAYDYFNYITNLSYTNIFSIPLVILSLLLIMGLTYYLISDILGIISLTNQQDYREKIATLIKENKVEELKNQLLSYKLTTTYKKKKLRAVYANLEDVEAIVSIYEEVILKETDKKVNATINKYALLSSGANMLSSKAVLDFFITIIIYSKMIIDIAKIYKIRLGICTFTKIMMAGLVGASFTTLTTKLLGSLLKNVSIIGTIGEIAIPGLVIRQLGLKVKYSIRPIKAQNSTTSKKDLKELEKDISNFSENLSKEVGEKKC